MVKKKQKKLLVVLIILVGLFVILGFSMGWFEGLSLQPLSIVGSYHPEEWSVSYDPYSSSDECKNLDSEFRVFIDTLLPMNDGKVQLTESPVKTFCGLSGGFYDTDSNSIFTNMDVSKETIKISTLRSPLDLPYLGMIPIEEVKIIGITNFKTNLAIGEPFGWRYEYRTYEFDWVNKGKTGWVSVGDLIDRVWIKEYDVNHIIENGNIVDSIYTRTGREEECIFIGTSSECTFTGSITLNQNKAYFLEGCSGECEYLGYDNGWFYSFKEPYRFNPLGTELEIRVTGPLLGSFELIKEQQFEETFTLTYTIPRETIPLEVHYRKYSCPVGGEYNLVSDTFKPGELISQENLRWDVAFFCERHPAILIQQATGSSENDLTIYKKLVGRESYIVPLDKEVNLFYVATGISKELAEKTIEIGELTDKLNDLEVTIIEKALLIEELTRVLAEQGEIVNSLELTIAQKTQIIQELTQNLDEQLVLIEQLELNLNEKIQLVSDLTTNINEQAVIIQSLTSQVDEQVQIIESLELNIQQQAQIISQMELTVFEQSIIIEDLELNIQEQAIIIDNLNINLQQKIELISQLELTNEEQRLLVEQMTLSFAEQQEIMNALEVIIEDDAQQIINLKLTIQESANYINALELTVSQQADLISQLKLTNIEQAQLIADLKLNNEETAQLIADLNLLIGEQADIISALNLIIEDDAEIIKNLNLKLSEEAELIDNLQLTISDQIELISQLELSLSEEKELVEQLSLTLEEQEAIIKALKEKKVTLEEIWEDYKLWIILASAIFLLLIILSVRKKKR